MLSCEFCKTFKNTNFFHGTPTLAGSVSSRQKIQKHYKKKFVFYILIDTICANVQIPFLPCVTTILFIVPGAQKWEEGGGLPHPFQKIEEKPPDFWKKDHDCVHPWVFSSTLSFESIFVKNYWKLFPPHFFLDLLAKCLSKCLVPRNLPCPGKSLVAPL